MKANEAPEKLYIALSELTEDGRTFVLDHRVDYPICIEYTRTDAFIEKACEWVREFNNHHHIMRYSDSCEPPLSELTEWFRNYMEGE